MIQRIRTLLAIATTSFCLLGIQSLQAQDRDRVFPVKGPAVTGKIVEKNRDKVVIEVRGNNQNFPSNEILRVLFEGEPTTLSRTKDLVAQGQIEQAVDEFWEAMEGSKRDEGMTDVLHSAIETALGRMS